MRRVAHWVVPLDMSPLSSISTRSPRMAASRAMPAPLMPAPTTIRSKGRSPTLFSKFSRSIPLPSFRFHPSSPNKISQGISINRFPATTRRIKEAYPRLMIPRPAHARRPCRCNAGGASSLPLLSTLGPRSGLSRRARPRGGGRARRSSPTYRSRSPGGDALRRDGDEGVGYAGEGGHDGVRLGELLDGGRRRRLATQQPDGVQPGLFGGAHVV